MRCHARCVLGSSGWPRLRGEGFPDPFDHVGKEWIGRHSEQRVETDSERIALASRLDGAEVDAKIVRGIGMCPIQTVGRREWQGDMRQRVDFARVDKIKRSDLFDGLIRIQPSLHDLISAGTRIGDDRRSELTRRRRQDPIQRDSCSRPKQRRDLTVSIDIKENEFAAVSGQAIVKRGHNCRGAHGAVNHRLESQDRREIGQTPLIREAINALLSARELSFVHVGSKSLLHVTPPKQAYVPRPRPQRVGS